MRKLIVLMLLLLASTVWAGDFEDAIAAHERGDYATALKTWRSLAAQGNAPAQHNLGVMYDKGQGIQQDYAAAVRGYRMAATQGNPSAQYNLGLMHYKGRGVPQNYSEAAKWFKLSEAQGYELAHYNLCLMYDEGHGVIQNFAEAVKRYKIAAAQGIEQAQSNLGVKYYYGEGVAKDNVRAYMWLTLAILATDEDINNIAAKGRDIVAKRMTPQQIAEAQKMARECQARKFKGCD